MWGLELGWDIWLSAALQLILQGSRTLQLYMYIVINILYSNGI
jgi:hypothetical protein